MSKTILIKHIKVQKYSIFKCFQCKNYSLNTGKGGDHERLGTGTIHYPLFNKNKKEKDISSNQIKLTEQQLQPADVSQKYLNYNKIDGKSSILTSYMVNVKSRRKREKSGTILLEGKRLIEDALDAGVAPLALFFSRPSDVADFQLNASVKLFRVTYKDLQFWSEVTTSQGIVGIFPIPDTSNFISSSMLPLTVVCDNVRDPGNMGSILRTSSAVGCQQLLLTKGCVDVWEPKVLRSAAGAHFRTRICQSLSWADVTEALAEDSAVYLADSDVPEPTPSDSDGVYELNSCGDKVPVPSEPPKRVTMYQKQLKDKSHLPLQEYTQPSYSSNRHIVLVVGGETQGLSAEALQLANTRSGTRVYVPLENGVESLNSGTALGILAYEIRRHFGHKT